uniref:Polymerase delta-interacting protein 3 n=1 Tax=Oryzias sinensis TaxID=183150 RepID=A0A8C7Z2N6_9TELE
MAHLVLRPPFGRGLGGDGKNFDARQIIGTSDVRQRLGVGTTKVKDAREKLVQKDARFKIQGRGGASAVQDARQMITSRKQGQTLSSIPAQTTLKAVISQQLQSKTLVPPIQIQTVSHFPGINSGSGSPTGSLLSHSLPSEVFPILTLRFPVHILHTCSCILFQPLDCSAPCMLCLPASYILQLCAGLFQAPLCTAYTLGLVWCGRSEPLSL